ncbi:cytoplasmic protein [Terribacillus saccharophilus]|uniref:DUF6434 domain-containing protein n=1 Tax=Terribacillus saccharophilus TaxID=361277 RepID=UPI000BA6EE00|nr:DUF6434 domain-containing protein [Terribacillus saccharophilus]PAF17669.1 cytoplasmic protein [Terribacillus saccharophilus]PAF21483.1 cytoplasmic protein [Terribacillus saccharophilus]PAF39221.1 cytoplasmic protein [Terribacillus saccharophilus]
MRPELTHITNADSFLDYYWLKEELVQFCRENDLPVSGSKMEITARIESFLRDGLIEKPARKQSRSKKKFRKSPEPLSRSTVITEDHRCSQQVRAFFKQEIGDHFHFSTYIQNYFRDNIGNTYEDAICAWHEEEARKQDPAYKKEIAPQFEYNRFIREFFSNPINKGKTRSQAVEAWNRKKSKPYSHSH